MACTVKRGPFDWSCASWPSDGENCDAMNMMVCTTPPGRSGTCEIWLEIVDLNHCAVSDWRNADNVGNKTVVGVL